MLLVKLSAGANNVTTVSENIKSRPRIVLH